MATDIIPVISEESVKDSLDGATITSATVATGDKVLIQDVDDSDNLKTVTAQSIADLSSGGGSLDWSTSEQTAPFTTSTGATVYQKTYTGTVSSSSVSGAVTETLEAATAFTRLLKIEGAAAFPSGTTTSVPIPYTNVGLQTTIGDVLTFGVYLASDGDVHLFHNQVIASTTYEVTIWYTK